MLTECNPTSMRFARLKGRDVVADFGGGTMTSDAGALLLGATGLVDRFSACFSDGRSADRVVHDVETMVGQRVTEPRFSASLAAVSPMVLVERLRGPYHRAMTEAIAFDTHRFVKRLTESGFTEEQAETLAEEHVALLNANLATKADIARIEAGMDALRQETKVGMEAVKADLLKWMLGALIAQGGLVVALVKLL